MNPKDLTIIAQVAGKIAGDILHGAGPDVVMNGTFAATTMHVYTTLLDTAGIDPAVPAALPTVAVAPQPAPVPQAPAVDPATVVQQAFTTPAGVAPVAVAPVAPTVSDALHQPGPAKQIHPGSTLIDKLEDALYHNPGSWKSWIDSDKSTVNGGRAPDLTHETLESGGYKVGIFLVDRKFGKNAPEWAFQKLGKGDVYANLVAAGTITP